MLLEDAIKSLFPRGYTTHAMYRERIEASRRKESFPARSAADYSAPPSLAVDLFAIAATLLLRSGAYHHVAPHMLGDDAARTVAFSCDEQQALIEAGAAWRGDGLRELPEPPPLLLQYWDQLWSSRGETLFHALPRATPVPDWWRSALALLIIADEAAQDIGFRPQQDSSAQASTVEAKVNDKLLKGREHVHTFSSADSDVASVLPKSRTPSVGCTLRSLSHHLALLPPRGLARAYWVPPPGGGEVQAERSAQCNPFNILMVPMPYKLRARSFKGRKGEPATNWGWFHVEPEWAPRTDTGKSLEGDLGLDQFWQFLLAMIGDAERDVGRVHAVIFPETAMGWQTYEALAVRLRDHSSVELLVSGLFDMATKESDGMRLRRGNFAAMAQFPSGGDRRGRYPVSVREKHHRWKLDRAQIQGYALGSSLDPQFHWWEEITIESRSIDIFTLRGSATLTTLICEDLARHDPCQELIRGIGPNLVFALLMDGAQLPSRWSGRYATVLADDPGSSVLTFTSLGLIERTNDAGILPKSRQVGLWRDDRGQVTELSVPADAHGLCITLQPTPFVEYTLDGRKDDGGTQSWRLAAIRPVKGSGGGAAAILDGRWPA